VALAKAGVLANSLVFLSEGTSFMLAGDEFSRTKGGNSNSYNASYQVNELNYELKARFAEYVGYYGQLIKMKQTIDGLHLGKNQVAAMSVTSLANGGIIKQVFKDAANNKEYVAYHCNGTADVTAATIDFTGYTQTLDTLGLTRSGSFSPTRYEVLVGVKDL
jgi:pullulanase